MLAPRDRIEELFDTAGDQVTIVWAVEVDSSYIEEQLGYLFDFGILARPIDVEQLEVKMGPGGKDLMANCSLDDFELTVVEQPSGLQLVS